MELQIRKRSLIKSGLHNSLILILIRISFGIFMPGLSDLCAQPVASQDTAQQEITPIPIPEIAIQSTQTSSFLLEKRNVLLTDELKMSIEVRLDTLASRLNTFKEDPRNKDIEDLNYRNLQTLEREWGMFVSALENEQNTLTGLVQNLEKEKMTLNEMNILWQKTLSSARDEDAPETVIEQINSTLKEIDLIGSSLQSNSDFLQGKLVEISTGLIYSNEILEKIRINIEIASRQLLSPDKPPIWKEFTMAKDTTIIKKRREYISETATLFKSFISNNSFQLKLHIILLVVILFLLVYSFNNLKKYIPGEKDTHVLAMQKILKRPVSVTLLIFFLLTYILYQSLPEPMRNINSILILVPVLFILSDIVTGIDKKFVYLPVTAFFLIQIHNLSYEDTLFSRIFLLLIILFGIVSLTHLVRSKVLREIILRSRFGKIKYWLSLLSLIIFCIAFLSGLFGGAMLAEFLTYSIIKSAALAILLYALSVILISILVTSLQSKGLQHLNFIRQYHEKLQKRIVNIITLTSWILWLIFSLSIFTVWDEVWGWIRKVLTHSWKVGTLDISIGNVLAFFFIVWLTLWLSRMIRIIVEGEVVPRVKFRRGVPGAISLMIRISVITIGFLLAIAAAGVEMNKLAILLGAFGVGIGFGLQNIFNNLVSGIILAFERPLNEGDIIEVGEHWGTVKQIGIRASTIRTFDGAEVVIPNGNLLSNELINWTLTDQQRRAEVLVGVKYGTDPEQVLRILRDVAGAHEEILKDPRPLALFTEFGESSLNFRLLFWIPLADDRLRIQSEITVAVNKALKNAGIEIPFPQRDLHMRSLDPKIIDDISLKKNSNR